MMAIMPRITILQTHDFAYIMTLYSCMAFKSAALAGVSIDRLHTLCAVVEAGTIVAAAGPEPNRQSQFSRQLKELENAIGTPLFDRIGKTLKPNEAGRRVALATQTFFGALDDVMNAANAKAETVSLGAGEAILRWFVMPHLGELMIGRPPLRFDVRSLTNRNGLAEVLAAVLIGNHADGFSGRPPS